MSARHPRSTLFPYTTLFRSLRSQDGFAVVRAADTQFRRRLGVAVSGITLQVSADGFGCGSGITGETCNVIPDRKSTRLNSSHTVISYAVFCLKKKKVPRDLISPTAICLNRNPPLTGTGVLLEFWDSLPSW